jgi:hypothetical protein
MYQDVRPIRFEELTITQQGPDTLIAFRPGYSIRLLDQDAAAITRADFILDWP